MIQVVLLLLSYPMQRTNYQQVPVNNITTAGVVRGDNFTSEKALKV